VAAVVASALLFAALTALRRATSERRGALQAELARHPASLQARLGLLNAACERRDAAAAQPLAESIVALAEPGDRAASRPLRARPARLRRGDEERGAAAMQRCRDEIVARGRSDDLDAELHLAWVALANFRRTRFGPADAEALLREGDRAVRPAAALLEALAVARASQGDPTAARRALPRGARGGEESATLALPPRARAGRSGRRDEARSEVERALALDPRTRSRSACGRSSAVTEPSRGRRPSHRATFLNGAPALPAGTGVIECRDFRRSPPMTSFLSPAPRRPLGSAAASSSRPTALDFGKVQRGRR
jgi:hypothetical protein